MSDHERVVVGRKPVLEALRAGVPVEKILLRRGVKGSPIEELRRLARREGVTIEEMEIDQFQRRAGKGVSQGVLALVQEPKATEIEDILATARNRGEQPLLLLLDEIEDPQNVGALLRSAECAGLHGAVLLKHHSPPLGGAVAKTSAGASFHLPIARTSNLSQTIERLKAEGIWVVGTDGSADKVYDEYDYTGPTAIVVGNEGRGMRRLVREMCDVLVRIPLYGKIESLNASVAGALVMFEAARCRRRSQN